MRLFVAVWPDQAAQAALARLPQVADAPVRWSRPEQWHVTLAFLGAVDPDRVPQVISAMEGLGGMDPAPARLGPTTVLLTPELLCAPVHGLDQLSTRVRALLAADGVAFDRRPFRGHCTLARARRGALVPPVLAGEPVRAWWTVRRVDVVASEAGAGGTGYRVLAQTVLDGP